MALYGIQAANQGFPPSQYGTVATTIVIYFFLVRGPLGSALFPYTTLFRSAIVAGVISIILIYFGGRPGQIGGIVGILGAILAGGEPDRTSAPPAYAIISCPAHRSSASGALPLFSIFILLQAPLMKIVQPHH